MKRNGIKRKLQLTKERLGTISGGDWHRTTHRCHGCQSQDPEICQWTNVSCFYTGCPEDCASVMLCNCGGTIGCTETPEQCTFSCYTCWQDCTQYTC